LKEHVLDQIARRLPVIVKFSNDTPVEQVPALLDLLFELGYDGVNFGNTSIAYDERKAKIDPAEVKRYEHFTKEYGGGVSGRPLRKPSLELASRAVEHIRAGPPSQEFHVIRTGGIETLADIQESEKAGISLNQWITGYIKNLSTHGHDVYAKLLAEDTN